MCVMIAAWELPHGDNNSHWLKFAMVLLILTGHDLIDPYELPNIIFTLSLTVPILLKDGNGYN